MSNVHRFSLRVYLEDTDGIGIVYYANYLKFAERARTEFLRYFDISHAEMIKEQGVMFVVRTCTLNCLASARLDDVLEVRTHLKKPGRAKLEVSQAILREEKLIATLEVTLACINPMGKPVRLDTDFVNKMWTHVGEI